MQTEIGGTPAVNGDDGNGSAGNESETVVVSRGEYDKLREKAGKYHEAVGKYHKTNDELQKLKGSTPTMTDDDYDDLSEDEKLEKLAEKKVDQILSERDQRSLEQKEEAAFLQANPEAYERLDEIRSLKRQNPGVSLNKLYKFFIDEDHVAEPQPKLKGSAPSKVTYDDFSPQAVNEGLKELTGRN